MNFLWKAWESSKISDNIWKWQMSKMLARRKWFYTCFMGKGVFVWPISLPPDSNLSYVAGTTIFETWFCIKTFLFVICFSYGRWIISEVFGYLNNMFHCIFITFPKTKMVCLQHQEGWTQNHPLNHWKKEIHQSMLKQCFHWKPLSPRTTEITMFND